MMEQKIYDVSQVNGYIKSMLDGDAVLGSLCIRGELSNYKIYPSGHHYFTLKDATSAMRCVMFRGSASHIRFRPENGMKVLATGRITVYERDGAYQLYCEDLIPEGMGDLHVAYEQLKKKLFDEGLFAVEHKKKLPVFPHRIAIITSSAGAAIQDMLRILGKRYPLSKVILLPVRVQGAEAPAEICGAIRYANRFGIADVIITGRGGGSIEDLWAFNDENVARAIYASEIPVVSAVGHEPDVTIADYTADLRAATPSNGAELTAPDQMELRETIRHMQSRMAAAMSRTLKLDRQKLESLSSKRVLQSPQNYIADKRLQLDFEQRKFLSAAQRLIDEKKKNFIRLTAGLDAMSPLKVLGRGYCMAKDAEGKIIRSATAVSVGSKLTIHLEDGRIHAVASEIERGAL